MTDETYEQIENILLGKEVKHLDWLRVKGTTPAMYQAIIETASAYSSLQNQSLIDRVKELDGDVEGWAIQWEMVNKQSKQWCGKAMESANQRRQLQSEIESIKKERDELKERMLAFGKENNEYFSEIEALKKDNERLKGLLEKPDWPTLEYVHELEENNKTLKDTIEQLKLFSQNNRQ